MIKLPFRKTLIDRSTVRYFRKHIGHRQKTAFSDLLDEILRSEIDRITDPVTQSHTVFMACFLSSYRLLVRIHDSRASAIDELRPVLLGYGRLPVTLMTRLFFMLPGDPIKKLKQISLSQLERKYGPKFEFADEDLPDGFVTVVTKCGFYAFLQRHDEEHPGPLLCEWDTLWIESLPAGVRFNRPCTIAQGCKTCRFEYRTA